MTKILSSLLICVTYLFFPIAYSQDENTAPFLLICPDSRAFGLGLAGVSSTPDGASMHWNPAKFAFIEASGVSLNHTPQGRDLYGLFFISAYYTLDKNQAFAASVKRFSNGGYLYPFGISSDFAYSRLLNKNFSFGLAIRYVYSEYLQGTSLVYEDPQDPNFINNGNIVGSAIAFDISGYYNKILSWNTPTIFALGANISNIGNRISYSENIQSKYLPTNLRLGSSLKFDLTEHNNLELMADLNKLIIPFSKFIDITDIKTSIGIEYTHKSLALQAGYYYENNKRKSFYQFLPGGQFISLGGLLNLGYLSIGSSFIVLAEKSNTLSFTNDKLYRFSLGISI